MRRLLMLSTLLLTTACASMGSEWENEVLLELEAGVTTEDDALALFGEPLSLQRLAGGETLMAFRDTDTHWLIRSEFQSVTLFFERGRLVRVFQTTNLPDELLDRVEERVPVQTRL